MYFSFNVLLDDVVLSAEMVDLVIYTMVALGGSRKESWKSDNDSLVEATMVASTLHLLHGFISPEFQDIVFVLLAHSKVDLFIEAAFGAVHNVVRSLTAKLLYHRTDHLPKRLGANPLGGANFHCQQAEAALQFLHSLCQEKLFSERVAKNKELCGKGGLLMIAESILSLAVSPGFVREARTIASMNRIKAKVLHLEEEATVDYDLFRSAGCVLSAFSSSGIWNVPQFKLNFQNNLTMSSYAHQRTSLLVKIIANLHCFSLGICTEDDRNRFINSFVSGLRKDPVSMTIQLANSSYTPVAQRATSSLLLHAEYLIASALNVKDLMMLSQAAVKKQRKEPLNLNIERASDGVARKNDVNENVEIVPRLKESGADARNIETSGLDTRSKRGKSLVEEGDLSQDFTKLFKGSGSGEGKEDEKKGKKRKRSIMSDDQMEMMEKAIADEPFMQRDSAWIRTWAEKLNQNGPGITALQLKNWLSNRRAKLARTMSGKTRKCKK
ncbi:hypothetical protein Bca4012_026686 [Brassica carinata]